MLTVNSQVCISSLIRAFTFPLHVLSCVDFIIIYSDSILKAQSQELCLNRDGVKQEPRVRHRSSTDRKQKRKKN